MDDMGEKETVRKRVVESLFAELESSGFRLGKGNLIVQLSSEFTGNVGLNFTSHRTDGLIGLNPIMNIVCRQIEDVLVDLTEGAERRPVPSLTTALGYLTPEHRFLEWLFDPKASPADHVQESKRIAKAITLYGVPFLREHASLETVASCLEQSKFSFVERTDYHLPVAYRLLREEPKAAAFVQRRLADLNNRTDMAANQYRQFAEKFLSGVTGVKQLT
jgi:hypothetical protein